MPGSKLTIRLTEEQQRQIRDVTGKSISDLDLAPDQLTETELSQVTGGATFIGSPVVGFTFTGKEI